MSILKHISLILFLFVGINVWSQNYTAIAYNYYKNSQLDSALININKAIETKESKNTQTWQLRGIIYRQLEGKSINLEYREIAIESFLSAKKVDTLNKDSERISKYLTQINTRYYNNAVTYLHAKQLEMSYNSFITYQNNFNRLKLDTIDMKPINYKYYIALAGSYIQNSTDESPEEKVKYYNQAITYYKKVLKIDSTDYKSNYGIGLSYYNQAVDLVMGMNPFETSIEDIEIIQNKSLDLFKKGEPYLLRAYKNKPNEIEVLEGLTGVYSAMNDDDKYMYYDSILTNLKSDE